MLVQLNPERPAGASSPGPLPQVGTPARMPPPTSTLSRALLTAQPPTRAQGSETAVLLSHTSLTLSQPLGHLFLLTENENG